MFPYYTTPLATTYCDQKLSTSIWDDERTICYQVDVQGVCVARRQDNDMINGTKLLNVTGMSRGKRDGILKNEKGRVVVKVGAMHLKGVWVTFSRAKSLAIQYNILDQLYPLFVDDPSTYLYPPFNYYPFYSAPLLIAPSVPSMIPLYNNNVHELSPPPITVLSSNPYLDIK